MKKSFLMVERIIMESLNNGKKDKSQLHLDTKLNIDIIHNVLQGLTEEGFLIKEDKYYILNRDKLAQEIDQSSVKREVKELFVSWVNRFFFEEKEKSTCLKVQKIYMNNAEEFLYNEHLKKLNNFLEGVKKVSLREKRKGITAKKKVIFWGHGEYQALVESSLNSV